MSDFYSRRADLPLFSALEPEPTMPPERPRTPPEPSEPRRTEILPTAAAVAQKRAGRRERMLERLRCGPATTLEMMLLGGAGFSSRIHELREAGWKITCEELDEGAVYRLEG